MKEIKIFLDVPVNAGETNVDHSIDVELSDALLTKEQDDIGTR